MLDLRVAPDTDLVAAEHVLQEAATHLIEQEPWNAIAISDAEVWGVEDLGGDGALIRLVIKTAPGQQYKLLRELRLVVKQAFDEAGIQLAVPVGAARPDR